MIPGPSLIRALTSGAPPGTIQLGLGQPSWPLPEAAREALARVDAAPYGPHAGDEALRRAVAAYEGASPEEVLITCGAQGALFLLSQTCLAGGGVALVPDPGFPSYPALAELAGGRAVHYPLDEENGFRLDADALLEVLDETPRVRLVVINHPANPTGGGASPEAIDVVARACEERGVLLVSDEVYRELYFDRCDRRPVGLRDVSRSGAVVGSLSKAWAAPGLRIGWLVAEPDVVRRCRSLQGWAVTSAAGPSQVAALALLESGSGPLRRAREELERRWEVLKAAWREEMGWAPRRPAGSIYLWLRLPDEAVADPVAYCTRLRDEAGVTVIPGAAFGRRCEGWARLSFGGPPDELREGVRRLSGVWRRDREAVRV